MKKPCKECPWMNDNPHSTKFREWSGRFGKHSCHMESSDVWGLKTNITENNICIGYKLNKENERNKNITK
jgi:hypothetical protein